MEASPEELDQYRVAWRKQREENAAAQMLLAHDSAQGMVPGSDQDQARVVVSPIY